MSVFLLIVLYQDNIKERRESNVLKVVLKIVKLRKVTIAYTFNTNLRKGKLYIFHLVLPTLFQKLSVFLKK